MPIPGAKNKRQCLQNIGALELKLSSGEMAALDEASRSTKKSMVQNSMASS